MAGLLASRPFCSTQGLDRACKIGDHFEMTIASPNHARRRVIGSIAVLAAPVILALFVLVALGQLRPLPAIVAATVICCVITLACHRHFRQLEAVVRHADGMAGSSGPAAQPTEDAALATELRAAVDRLHDRLAAERQRLDAQSATADAILGSLPDPLIILSGDRRVLRINEAAAGLLGRNLEGRDLALALRHPTALEAVDAVLAGTAANREVEFALRLLQPRDFSLRVVALPRVAGDGSAAILTLHELTAVKRSEQMRADFVANASHELRTPLATLIGFIETLQGPARDDAAARARFLGIMQQQAERMARLIRDLLSLSQIELNEHTPPQGRVDLPAVLGNVAEMLEMQAAAKGMRIRIDAPEALPAAIGERDELTQVFQNLLDNAIKYGRPNTTIDVAIRAQAPPPSGPSKGIVAAVMVSVRDNGEGIAREHLPRLTERFYRVDSARSRALGGTGLGLAIVKHIVNRHRGALTIDSTLGEGSVFAVFLPAAEGASATTASANSPPLTNRGVPAPDQANLTSG